MYRKFKYSPELKVKACEEYLSGCFSILYICNRYDINYNHKKGTYSIYDWLHIYRESGAEGFSIPQRKISNTQKS